MMKKLILLSTLIGFAMLVNAQSTEFHAFKWDVGGGYAVPSQGNTLGGGTFTLQPHYRLSNDFALGIRMEVAGLLYRDASGHKQGSAIASGCLTGEFYLSDGGFRPFIGAGLGFYDQATISGNNGDGDGGGNGPNVSPRVINFGAFPEVGF